ncbi:peptidoglycan-binding protein [Candidatus Kaiserbacteria bacterium]|nr:peptidoglycan-binding protein [Candidatus Kaiserbacteria bacterium]
MKSFGFTQSTHYFIGLVILSTLLAIPSVSAAQTANECSFSRTLEDGVDGEDVRCLQKYLNDNGFVIAESGPGAVGHETNLFRTLTKEAVVKWQKAKNVNPASGVFGPQSQAAYLLDLIAKIEGKKADTVAVATAPTPAPQVAGISTSAIDENKNKGESILKDAFKMMRDAEKQVDDLDDESKLAKLNKNLTDARIDLYDALESFFDEDYKNAYASGQDALDAASKVFEKAGGETYESKADDVLSDVTDLLEDVQGLYSDAKDNKADVGDSKKMISEAEDLLNDAQDEFDKRGYKQAISDALDAEEILNDAKDEIDFVGEKDVEGYIEEVRNELDDAEDEINDADDDGEDVDDAWDLFKDAEKKLNKADLAIDDEEYLDAQNYAEDAQDLIDEALDSISGSSSGDEKKAKKAVANAWDDYDDAKNDISDAEDDGDNMDDAWDLLKDAKKKLNKADDSYDDEEYQDALDYVDDAEDLIDEALDEL